MGRKTLVDKLLEAVRWEDEDYGTYLIIYDFTWDTRPSKEFYHSLARLGGVFINRSCVLVKRRRHALAAKLLAKHYGANVFAYKIAEEI